MNEEDVKRAWDAVKEHGEPVEQATLSIEYRVRRLWIITLATQIAMLRHKHRVPEGSICDRLFSLATRLARPEYRVADGPWQPMGAITMSRVIYDEGMSMTVSAPEEE